MFSAQIVTADAFLEMPMTSQALYFHLGMSADDDGFVSPRKILRMIGAGEDDLKVLLSKGFVIPFQSGVIVITHWKPNNSNQADRYTPTIYKDERASLSCIQNVYRLDTNDFQNGRILDSQGGREEGRKREVISKKNEDELSQMRIDAYFKKGHEVLKSRHKFN
jgi:hypothetical protein